MRVPGGYEYDPETGEVTRYLTGEPVKIIKRNGYACMMYDGRVQYLSQLIVGWMLGFAPRSRVFFRDGNARNFRWDNLDCKDKGNVADTRARESGFVLFELFYADRPNVRRWVTPRWFLEYLTGLPYSVNSDVLRDLERRIKEEDARPGGPRW